MTNSPQAAMGYFGVVVSMVVLALPSVLGDSASSLSVMVASLAMLNVVTIAHASDRTFLHRHRFLVGMLLCGLVLPSLYTVSNRILTASDWPFFDATRIPVMMLSILIVGESAVVGFLRATGNVTVTSDTTSTN
ncbi:MAG: hypothetical protein U0905_02440 [Pirellulales bacterium]